MTPTSITLFGVDFTSAPRRSKLIVVARARLCGAPGGDRAPRGSANDVVRVEALAFFDSFAGFERWLASPGPWVAALDLPFGLPRGLMASWGWCATQAGACTAQTRAQAPGEAAELPREPDWSEATMRLQAMSRDALVSRLRAYCDARPTGSKFAHRRTDALAGSSPSMKWVNPPVALMLHEGVPRLLRAGAHLPGLGVAGDGQRVLLEGYPGLVARALVGRVSYKSDDRARQTVARAEQRARMLERLEAATGQADPGYRAAFRPERRFIFEPWVRQRCQDDPSGDALDAVLCVALAAWAWQRREQGWGLPSDTDPLEGWIVGA